VKPRTARLTTVAPSRRGAGIVWGQQILFLPIVIIKAPSNGGFGQAAVFEPRSPARKTDARMAPSIHPGEKPRMSYQVC
jgi:hypothetical protein